MKKILDFITSLILPRKMYRYHNMKVIYSVGIFIVSIVILLFSINLTTKSHMYEKIEKPDFDKYDYEIISEKTTSHAIVNDKIINDINIPKYKITTSNSGGYYLDVDYPTDKPDTFQGVFTKTYKNKTTGKKLEVKIILDEVTDFFDTKKNMTLFDERVIDLEGYICQKKDENTEYLLVAFTKKSFYYLYNMGQVFQNGKWQDTANTKYGTYELDTNNEYIYYLPTVGKEVEEITKDAYGNYDTSKWSTITTEGAKATYIVDGEEVELTAAKKMKQNVRYMVYNGEYIYSNTDIETLNDIENGANFYNSNFENVAVNLITIMAEADTNIQKSFYTIFVFIINLVLSLLWVFITWLLSRKFVLNKFREYYAICSITYVTSSVIGCILGFFIRFDTLMLVMLAVELLYYIVATFRINTDPKLLNPTDDENENSNNQNKENRQIETPKLNFKKVKPSDDSFKVE